MDIREAIQIVTEGRNLSMDEAAAVMTQILIYQLASTAGINEVVKADPGDIHFFKELEYFWYFLDIELVDRKTKSDFYTCGLAVFDAFQGRMKCAADASEAIVDLLHPVQTDADIRQPDFFQITGRFRRD